MKWVFFPNSCCTLTSEISVAEWAGWNCRNDLKGIDSLLCLDLLLCLKREKISANFVAILMFLMVMTVHIFLHLKLTETVLLFSEFCYQSQSSHWLNRSESTTKARTFGEQIGFSLSVCWLSHSLDLKCRWVERCSVKDQRRFESFGVVLDSVLNAQWELKHQHFITVV